MDSLRRKEIEERVETVRGRFYDEHSDTSYLLTVWAELTRMEQALAMLVSEMRGEVKGKTLPIVHDAATAHWADKLDELLGR